MRIINNIKMCRKALFSALCCLLALLPAGCIKNDLPYPRIPQNILGLAVDGESKSAYIDTVTMRATVYLDETSDIQKVKFTEFSIPDGCRSSIDLLDGEWNLSKPMYVTLSLYQDYDWEIRAVQDIERYFRIDGEVGESVIDPVAHRVIVHMPENTDLSKLNLLAAKLGPKDISTYDPQLVPGPINLQYPLRVTVTAWDREEIWTIYAEIIESMVATTRADAWSQVIWAYGTGPADAANTFQYRKKGDADWIDVAREDVTQSQGVFSCCIKHLEPLTEYEVRAVSDENVGNVVAVVTQSTADIPNGDFENWHLGGSRGKMWCPWAEDGPQFWDTGNTGASIAGKTLTSPSDHTPGNSGRSAQMTCMSILGKLAAGSIFTGSFRRIDGTNGILDFGRPWNLRPTKLRGYFQYQSETINITTSEYDHLKGRPDSCHIYVALADWSAQYEVRTNPKNRQLFNPNSPSIIAYGELTCGEKMSGYQPFEIVLHYRDTNRVPTFLQITCAASKYGDYFTGGAGSTLYVDQLSFDWDY